MGAQENKQSAQAAYAAFSSGDAEGAMPRHRRLNRMDGAW